jgi:hypothetical protein
MDNGWIIWEEIVQRLQELRAISCYMQCAQFIWGRTTTTAKIGIRGVRPRESWLEDAENDDLRELKVKRWR